MKSLILLSLALLTTALQAEVREYAAYREYELVSPRIDQDSVRFYNAKIKKRTVKEQTKIVGDYCEAGSWDNCEEKTEVLKRVEVLRVDICYQSIQSIYDCVDDEGGDYGNNHYAEEIELFLPLSTLSKTQLAKMRSLKGSKRARYAMSILQLKLEIVDAQMWEIDYDKSVICEDPASDFDHHNCPFGMGETKIVHKPVVKKRLMISVEPL